MDQKFTDTTWPDWKVVRMIGRGSFGTVYEIQRNILGDIEKAALKIITIPQNAEDIEELRSEGYDNTSITARFQSYLQDIVREYKVMARMKGQRNIVLCEDVHFVQHDDAIGWDISIKMELLTPILKLTSDFYTESEVIHMGIDLCHALEACKKEHIIHRDIKPQNIFISRDGDYKLGDFGTAKVAERTAGGTKAGTYKYMAPEVYNNQPYGHAADIYSLGMVLYWLLNNRRAPFLPPPPAVPTAADEEAARIRRYKGERIPAPAHGSAALKKVILKACAFDPEQRYNEPSQMRRDLEKLAGIGSSESTANQSIRDTDETEATPIDTRTIGTFRDKKPDESTLTIRDFSVQHNTKRKKQKRKYGPFVIVILTIIAVVAGIAGKAFDFHKHKWSETSCEAPEQCLVCGETRGVPADHRWKKATCETPQTCIVCDKTEGAALGHIWEVDPDTKLQICSICGITDGAVQTSDEEKKILETASMLKNMNQYRLAIQVLDNAWFRYGNEAFFKTAAEYRKAFGLYNISVLSAGKYNTAFLVDGKVFIIGDDSYGELAANDWENIVAINAGDEHIVGLKNDGTVVAAGSNAVGQCDVTQWTNMEAIYAGDTHTVGLGGNGTLVTAAGENSQGQCDVDRLMKAAGEKEIVSIAAGYVHTLALLSDGSVIACGGNDTGACDVDGWTNIVSIYAGSEFSAGLKNDGTVVVTGLGTADWQVSGWNNIDNLAAGDYYLIGIKNDGSVLSVGLNDWRSKDRGQMDVASWSNIAFISAGNNHTVSIDANGLIKSTGANNYGQCDADNCMLHNLGSLEHILPSPKEGVYYQSGNANNALIIGKTQDNSLLFHYRISDVILCNNTLASFEKGAFHFSEDYGKDINGNSMKMRGSIRSLNDGAVELSIMESPDISLLGTTIFKFENDLSEGARDYFEEATYSSVSGGYQHSIALRKDGCVIPAGSNEEKQCDVSSWRNIIEVSAGEYYTLGLREDGSVIATGKNEFGQCNISDWRDIIAISAGTRHSVGLRADGTVVAVGENKDGQYNVSGWRDIVAVEAGYKHTVGLKADGTVVATGLNVDGQCNVEGWTDIVAISSEGWHTVGVKSDGSVVAVGRNKDGQCNVSNWSNIIDVAAEGWHTVGLRADGTVIASGLNNDGQCNVSAWKDVVAIAAGNDHTIGLKSDGSLLTIGSNDYGQCVFRAG